MGIETLFLYIVASFGLAFLLNRLDKLGGESFFDGIILSGIYIIILAGVFSSYRMVVNNDNIFLVVFLAILELIFYQVVILESPFFLKENII